MKVVGLISGGKDGIYSLIECIRHGHEIVALANLYPKQGVDEADSHMFQTVGHQLVEAIGECMELPLYRAELIHGSEVKDLHYNAGSTGKDDEIEDLYNLLKEVKEKHPDVQAVSSGAILSSYQRLRIENVCSRLGLTSLSYLWRRDQRQLFEEMINSGIEAVLVKVASVGLSSMHLNRSLSRLHPILQSAADRYGASICGEGGEYETIVLDCPLFPRRRIVIDKYDGVGNISSPAEMAPVCYLKPTAFRIVDKTPEEIERAKVSVKEMPSPVEPTDVEVLTKKVNEQFISESNWAAETDVKDELLPDYQHYENVPVCEKSQANLDVIAQSSGMFRLVAQAVTQEYASNVNQSNPERDSELTRQALKALFKAYARYMCATSKCEDGSSFEKLESQAGESLVYVNLIIPSMDSFLSVNKVYQELVPLRAAPARACVASTQVSIAGVAESTVVPSNASEKDCVEVVVSVKVIVEGIFVPPKSKLSKSRMHVQSISDWAPASIGPYAQAYEIAGLLLPAGQIGLVPARLALPSEFPSIETRQAFLNVRNTLSALGSRMRRDVLHLTVYVADGLFPSSLQGEGRISNFNEIFASLAEGYEGLCKQSVLLNQMLHLSKGDQRLSNAHSLLLFCSMLRSLLAHPRRKPVFLMNSNEKLKYRSKVLGTSNTVEDDDDCESWGYDSLLAQAEKEDNELDPNKSSSDSVDPLLSFKSMSVDELDHELKQLHILNAQMSLKKAAEKTTVADLVDDEWEDDTGIAFGADGRLTLIASKRSKSNMENDSGSEDEDDVEVVSTDKLREPVTPIFIGDGDQTIVSYEEKSDVNEILAHVTALQSMSEHAPITFISVPTLPRQALVELQVIACEQELRAPLALRKAIGVFTFKNSLSGDVVVCEALVRAGAVFYTLTFLTKERASKSSEIDVDTLCSGLASLSSIVESTSFRIKGDFLAGSVSSEIVNRLVLCHPSLLKQERKLRSVLCSEKSFGASKNRLDPQGIVVTGSASTSIIQAAEAERTVIALHEARSESEETRSSVAILNSPPDGLEVAAPELLSPTSSSRISIHNDWVCAAIMSRVVVDPVTWSKIGKDSVY